MCRNERPSDCLFDHPASSGDEITRGLFRHAVNYRIAGRQAESYALSKLTHYPPTPFHTIEVVDGKIVKDEGVSDAALPEPPISWG